jgi:hypothetical protein
VYRDEIAGCSEKAYDSLSVTDAKKILMFSSDWELQEYVSEVCLCSVSLCAICLCVSVLALYCIVFLYSWDHPYLVL